jgi:hypothetical protein
MEARINGLYSARVMSNLTIEWNFTPTGNGCGNVRLILAPDVEHVENDLVTIFGLRPEQARAAVAKLEQDGLVDVDANVDAGLLPTFGVQRDATKAASW